MTFRNAQSFSLHRVPWSWPVVAGAEALEDVGAAGMRVDLAIICAQIMEGLWRENRRADRKRGFHTRITHTCFEAIGFRIQPLNPSSDLTVRNSERDTKGFGPIRR